MLWKYFAQISLATLLIGFIGIGVSTPVRAQTSNKILSHVEFEQKDVRLALRELFQQINVSYSIAPEVQGVITVDLRNVTFEIALQNVLRQVSATYRYEDGVYQIIARPTESIPPAFQAIENPPIDHFDFNHLEVHEALRSLFSSFDHHYSVAPEVSGFVTLAVSNLSYETILRLMLSQVNATFRFEGGIYEIVSKDEKQPGSRREPDPNLVAAISPQANDTAITQDAEYLYIVRGDALYKVQKSDLKLVSTGAITKADVRIALRQLFDRINASYTIDPTVEGSVSLDWPDKTFETTLQDLLAQVNATYRIEAGVYHIIPRSKSKITRPTIKYR